jgi:hypothetical protein
MHRGLSDRGCPAGSDIGLDGKQFLTELQGRGLSPDVAADIICQVYCIPRGAARLYVRTHPAWSPEAPADVPRRAEPPRWRMGV